jgi:hypothetical protein
MADLIDSAATRHLVPIVTLRWGNPITEISYIRWDVDFLDKIAAPELDVSDWKQDGTTKDTPITFVIGRDRAPIGAMTRPWPHAPVECIIAEGDPVRNEVRTVYRGTIAKTIRNSDGFRKLVKVQVNGIRERFAIPLGILVDSKCPWTFADAPSPSNCAIDPAPLRQNVSIDVMEKNVITISGGDSLLSIKDYLSFGSLTFDGLSIFIQSHDGAGHLVLGKIPPPEWQSAVAIAMPGCDKRIDTCRKKWSNEARFGGVGLAIPAYHPQIESPT